MGLKLDVQYFWVAQEQNLHVGLEKHFSSLELVCLSMIR
jgi:hypothetical protein